MSNLERTGGWSPVVGGLVALASVASVTGLVYGLREIMPAASTGVLYMLAVLLVSSYWGLWLGLATSVASVLALNFSHIPPTHRFTIADPEHWVALAAFFVAAVLTSTLAEGARARAREAEQRRNEADLTADMARLVLGSASTSHPLEAVGKRIANAYGLSSVDVDLEWRSSDERRRALPLVVDGDRSGTMMIPRDAPEETREALRGRIVPALEALVGATRRREALESQVIETKALRRSNVVKTTLLRSVSHDLRSPITAIKAAAEGLAAEGLSQEGQHELLSVVSTESCRLDRLVANLLDLSRLQSGAAEPRSDWVSVEESVRAALASVPHPAGGWDVSVDPEAPLIRVDAAQLERALANIADNAVRHADDAPVAVRVRSTGPRVLIRVSDRGPGIPREELERIFEPFHRVSGQPGGGSGLGLAIARGFIEANGGRVRAESSPGQGTTFTVDLPVPPDSRAEDRKGATERTPA
jgi:two-component system, OmpR family, sensor histidine kinase KdpD